MRRTSKMDEHQFVEKLEYLGWEVLYDRGDEYRIESPDGDVAIQFEDHRFHVEEDGRRINEFRPGRYDRIFDFATGLAEMKRDDFDITSKRHRRQGGRWFCRKCGRATGRSSRRLPKRARVTPEQLQEITDALEPISDEEAERLADRINRGSNPDSIMQEANELMDGFGIETLRDHDTYDSYWGDIVAEYINMGDQYALTLWYDVERDEFIVTDWSTYMRKLEKRYDELTQR